MSKTGLWRVRPAGATHSGQAVGFERLCEAINEELVGELDEVLAPGQQRWTTVLENPGTAICVPSQRRVAVREEDEAEADLTPMIDVTFQLVIFFMIAATYTIQKTLDLPGTKPPDDAAGVVTLEELQQNNILLTVAADGTVTMDDQVVPLEGLSDKLREANRQTRRSELVLDIHDQTIQDVVVKVLDAAGAAEIQKVLFVSRVALADARASP